MSFDLLVTRDDAPVIRVWFDALLVVNNGVTGEIVVYCDPATEDAPEAKTAKMVLSYCGRQLIDGDRWRLTYKPGAFLPPTHRDCSCQTRHPDSPVPCRWCDDPISDGLMGNQEMVGYGGYEPLTREQAAKAMRKSNEYCDEMAAENAAYLAAGQRSICPKCGERSVKHGTAKTLGVRGRSHPGDEYSATRECETLGCGYRDLA